MEASEEWTSSFSLMDQVGLSAIASGNSIAAIAASRQRITTREVDRVYGIQQIFGFRLGITLPGATPVTGFDFTKQGLELQFAKVLLTSYPILSQLHVFTTPVQLGSGWLLNSSSVPAKSTETTNFYALDRFGQHTSEVRASCYMTTIDLDSVTWGQFTGLLCSFEKVATKAAELDPKLRQEPLYGTDYPKISILEAYLDASDLICERLAYEGSGHHSVPSGDRQRALVQWLSESFPADHLQILLLGPELPYTKRYGLTLLREEESRGDKIATKWRRLGYCEWWCRRQILPDRNYDYLPLEMKCVFPEHLKEADIMIFQGYKNEWKEVSGYFG